MTYLKRLFMLLVLLMMLMKAGAVVPVYAWTGWDEKTTAKDLLKQFKDWKKRGVVGVCVNCGFNLNITHGFLRWSREDSTARGIL